MVQYLQDPNESMMSDIWQFSDINVVKLNLLRFQSIWSIWSKNWENITIIVFKFQKMVSSENWVDSVGLISQNQTHAPLTMHY